MATALTTPVITAVVSAGTTGGVLPGNTGFFYKVQAWPITTTFLGIWGSGASDIWVVGEGGFIMHWNGSAWSTVASGTTEHLLSVFGISSSDVWAVGSAGTIVHWNGATWSTVASSTTQSLHGVWGSGTSDVWAVGDSGTIVHWNGATWAAATSPTTQHLTGIYGNGASDIVACGQNGVILNYLGASWAYDAQNQQGGTMFTCVFALNTGNVYIGSSSWQFFLSRVGGAGGHWNNSGNDGSSSRAIWATTGPTIHVMGNTGPTLNQLVQPSWPFFGTTFVANGVWGSSASDVWAICNGNRLARFNGTVWSEATGADGFGFAASALSAEVTGSSLIGTNTNKMQIDWNPVANAGGYTVSGRLTSGGEQALYSEALSQPVEFFGASPPVSWIDLGTYPASGSPTLSAVVDFRADFATERYASNRGQSELSGFALGAGFSANRYGGLGGGSLGFNPPPPAPAPPPDPPPVVTNFDPALAATVDKFRTISFDVTNVSGLYRRIVVFVQYPGITTYDVAHDGSRFGDRYLQAQFNTKVAIAGGFRYTLLRKDGWPLSPRIVPIAIDTVGNENPVESQTYAWTLI